MLSVDLAVDSVAKVYIVVKEGAVSGLEICLVCEGRDDQVRLAFGLVITQPGVA